MRVCEHPYATKQLGLTTVMARLGIEVEKLAPARLKCDEGSGGCRGGVRGDAAMSGRRQGQPVVSGWALAALISRCALPRETPVRSATSGPVMFGLVSNSWRTLGMAGSLE
jgi:hypothetical protein